MKRIISVILAALLFCTLVACKREKETVYSTPQEGIVGVWKYSPNEEYREIITDAINDPRVYVDLYYEFYADGTGKTYLSTDDDEMEFTYSYDGEVLTINNSTGSFDTPAILDGDVLSVYAGNDEYFDLKRQK